MENRNNAYTEVYIILQNLEKKEYNKIPNDVINVIKSNRNLKYVFELDENLPLKYQSLLPETKAILFNLFKDYLSPPEQKEKIIKMQYDERKKIELKKQEKFKYDDLFISTKENDTKKIETNMTLVKIENESFLEKILKRIKKFLKKK